jgi:hypothetical protein
MCICEQTSCLYLDQAARLHHHPGLSGRNALASGSMLRKSATVANLNILLSQGFIIGMTRALVTDEQPAAPARLSVLTVCRRPVQDLQTVAWSSYMKLSCLKQ